MTTVVKIDGEEIDLIEFVRALKLTGQFEELLEQFVRDRLAAAGAKKAGIRVSEAEVQERADQYRHHFDDGNQGNVRDRDVLHVGGWAKLRSA